MWHPVLAAHIIKHSASARNVYDGGKPALIESFAKELPGVSLGRFLHLTSIVGHLPSWACCCTPLTGGTEMHLFSHLIAVLIGCCQRWNRIETVPCFPLT